MSGVVKRSISIRGHRTSFSLEKEFFDELSRMAATRQIPMARLVVEIDEKRARETNLSSALRLYVLENLRAMAGSSHADDE